MEKPKHMMTGEELLKRACDLTDAEELDGIPEAFSIYEFLLQHDRDNHGLVFLLGVCFMRQKRWRLAEIFFQRALDMAKRKGVDFAEAHNNMGFVLTAENYNKEALEHFDRAIDLKDDEPAFYNNKATLYVNAGQPNTCLEWTNKALALKPDDPDALWNRGLANLELGNWADGWSGYRAGLQITKWSTGRRKRRQYHEGGTPLWDGTPGKTVVIYGEQGVGDEILAASMIPDMEKVANVIYETHPRLVDIMRYSFGERFPIYGTRKETDVLWPPFHHIDAQLPIMQLGEYFRRRDADFPRTPYLKPYPGFVESYRSRLASLGPKPKIGISWKGGGITTRHDLRSLPLDRWLPIFASIDADWFSLQYDPAERPGLNAPIVEQFHNDHGVELHHWPDVLNDLDECYGGFLHALDLVISVNTSIVHACGAYGIPCWTLTPSRCAWRYNVPGAVSVGDERMIWYGDHVRQYRQKGVNWDAVIQRVADDLRAWYAEVTAA